MSFSVGFYDVLDGFDGDVYDLLRCRLISWEWLWNFVVAWIFDGFHRKNDHDSHIWF